MYGAFSRVFPIFFVLYLGLMIYIIYLFHTLAMSNKRMAETLERVMENISGKAGE